MSSAPARPALPGHELQGRQAALRQTGQDCFLVGSFEGSCLIAHMSSRSDCIDAIAADHIELMHALSDIKPATRCSTTTRTRTMDNGTTRHPCACLVTRAKPGRRASRKPERCRAPKRSKGTCETNPGPLAAPKRLSKHCQPANPFAATQLLTPLDKIWGVHVSLRASFSGCFKKKNQKQNRFCLQDELRLPLHAARGGKAWLDSLSQVCAVTGGSKQIIVDSLQLPSGPQNRNIKKAPTDLVVWWSPEV